MNSIFIVKYIGHNEVCVAEGVDNDYIARYRYLYFDRLDGSCNFSVKFGLFSNSYVSLATMLPHDEDLVVELVL